MATRTLGASPDKRRKYDEAFKAEALRLAEVGSEEVARDLEVRALRARLKRAEQELDILKSLGHLRSANPMSTYCHIAQRAAQVPMSQLCQVLRVLRLTAQPAAAEGRTGVASSRT